MSRVGRTPIEIPAKVEVSVNGNEVTVKGPLGKLPALTVKEPISVTVEGNKILVSRPDDKRQSRAFHGLYRSLINNMLLGVSAGFKKELEVNGVGYRAAVQGNKLSIQTGFTHPLEYEIPEGFTVVVENNTQIAISGPDKQKVGQMAATIRLAAPVDCYKLKGIKYKGEHIVKKAGKTVK